MRCALGLLCLLFLSGCTPPTWIVFARGGPALADLYEVSFAAAPQGVDKIYSENWPALANALKSHFPEEYWSAMEAVSAGVRAGQLVTNPLMKQFGHYAALAGDDAHRAVLEAFMAFLRRGMVQDEDFCLYEFSQLDLEEVQNTIMDAVADGIVAPVYRPAQTVVGSQVVTAYILKQGLEPGRFQSLLAGETYPGACGDFIIYLEALNHLDVNDAKVWRANIIVLWTGLL